MFLRCLVGISTGAAWLGHWGGSGLLIFGVALNPVASRPFPASLVGGLSDLAAVTLV
jgi:hypothetical protein